MLKFSEIRSQILQLTPEELKKTKYTVYVHAILSERKDDAMLEKENILHMFIQTQYIEL